MQQRIFVLTLGLSLAVAAGAGHAQTVKTGYGVVTGDQVRLRAGAADFHAEVLRYDRGDVVEIVGAEGDWVEVRIPGGFECFAKSGVAGRRYVEQKSPGEGLVLVEDLQLRPKPTLDYPSMGELRPNQRVIVLDDRGDGWLRLLSPEDETLFVYKTYVKLGDDQGALQTDFATKARRTRDALLKSGKLSSQAVARWADLEKWRQELESTDRDLDAVRVGADAAQLAKLAKRYENIAANTPEGSDIKSRANERLTWVRTRQDEAEKLAGYEKRIEELRTKMRTNEKTYEQNLKTYTTEVQKRRDTNAKTKVPEALEFGIGQMRPHLFSGLGERSVFTLEKAGKRRYFLVSERYDLSEYSGKTVRVVKWSDAASAADSTSGLRTVRVDRLEVVP